MHNLLKYFANKLGVEERQQCFCEEKHESVSEKQYYAVEIGYQQHPLYTCRSVASQCL